MSFRQGAEALADFFFPVLYDIYYARESHGAEGARRCVESVFEHPCPARLDTESPWFTLLRPRSLYGVGNRKPPSPDHTSAGGLSAALRASRADNPPSEGHKAGRTAVLRPLEVAGALSRQDFSRIFPGNHFRMTFSSQNWGYLAHRPARASCARVPFVVGWGVCGD